MTEPISDDLFRAAFEQAANPILIADDDGRYVAANEAAAELFGVSRAKLIGMRATDFVEAHQVSEIRQSWASFIGNRGQTGRFRLRRPDGEERTLQYHAVTSIRPGLHLSVLIDVTEVALAEARRQEVVDELQRERSLRETFVAALTHDLRTPLSAAKLAAELLRRKGQSSPEQQRLGERLQTNLDRMTDMVQDLLDANRIKAGEPLALDFEPVELFGLVRSVVDGLVQLHGDRFVLRGPATIEGRWNAPALRRVAENLLGNAVKYGEPGTPVTVTLARAGDGATLTVHNLGRPIPPAEWEPLFTAFRRAGRALESGQKGWGIGLALSRGLVEAHGGRLTLSRSDELGTEFTAWLPWSSG